MSAPNNQKYLLTVNRPAPIRNYKVGPYDGLILKSAQPNKPYQPMRNPMMVYQGTPLPLASEARPVDIPRNSMFYMAHNQANINCRSAFSTSTGQVCLTRQQSKYIAEERGNNKNFPNGSF
jgi:hypothetical protein